MLGNFLLKLARKVLDQVLGDIAKQITRVATEAIDPVSSYVSQVQGGAWVSRDADRFANEVNTVVLPALRQINQTTTNFSHGIRKAEEIVVAADGQAKAMVSELNGMFGNVF